ncbi:GNAT family N-acetyltransferase [Psychrobacillus sp. OK032]|uniref:GNAT family N-acetyltransferase n=1 Tax=Psychrobacillus sp. OK032 TaxID=1884358 RepID=UPI0008CB7998|nr:GNAT family N-acetyltransferase [Psychrobacillus sp. OK032]SES40831.1 mycothiol synthase [Psychrobacillus sp. OK032]
MKLELLTLENLADFVAYCKKYRYEIDDSFLYDEDLINFELSADNPTYIITDEGGDTIAVASLVMDDYLRKGRRARFRIFHAKLQNSNCYEILLKAILKHTEGIDRVFIFIPLTNKDLITSIKSLHFTVERYSFVLVREDLEIADISFPKNYVIRPFRPGKDEGIWCEVRNAGFANLKGSETPISSEMVTKMIEEKSYIEGGMMILFHGEKPVGIVRGEADEYEGEPIMSIGPLAILPEYQGQGLGRMLPAGLASFCKGQVV